MLKTTLIAALFALAGIAAQAQTATAAATPEKPASSAPKAEADPEVKKSNAGICHDKTSPSYKQTKNFTAFKTMDECTKSGGRAPKK